MLFDEQGLSGKIVLMIAFFSATYIPGRPFLLIPSTCFNLGFYLNSHGRTFIQTVRLIDLWLVLASQQKSISAEKDFNLELHGEYLNSFPLDAWQAFFSSLQFFVVRPVALHEMVLAIYRYRKQWEIKTKDKKVLSSINVNIYPRFKLKPILIKRKLQFNFRLVQFQIRVVWLGTELHCCPDVECQRG